MENNKRLEDLDKAHIWHPFTQMKDWINDTPIVIAEGHDCFIKDTYGRWYIDGVSSLWVNIHGHGKKEINDALINQLTKISHSTLLGLANVPSTELAGKLISLVGEHLKTDKLNKVFYSDNGSTAVEAALKMAFQYTQHTKKCADDALFVTLENGYHGDTIGAVSAGGIDLFHKTYAPLLFKTVKTPSPYCFNCSHGVVSNQTDTPSKYRCNAEGEFPCLRELRHILGNLKGNVAAVLIEPLIQAASGMITSPVGYLRGVRDLCTEFDTLLIADEVATGFGRTGTMFACEREGVVPDILCLSKGITGGYLPLAVTIATETVYNAFLGEFAEKKTFFHGHSYTGNQLGCAAALASLEIFEKEHVLANLKPKIKILRDWLNSIFNHPNVGDVRVCGMMAGVELIKDKASMEPFSFEEKAGWQVAYEARKRSVFIRPLGNVLVIMPPLSISEENLLAMLIRIEKSIDIQF
ncbi:MAG: adenosylmethionine--8-amino-7-oxononanoate transaminase [Nitrospirae bacterium]|nr:adenosylmethionine--8-amino-7-oxononanoate transaminase [Nitrospirota bacterium]MBF0535873.1 adenosylmethionine--8-amino-7-oxononanoate transaminase [Nitrospirota bacterium]MBF0617793.1 adenosylmethionine--8-amino-7-oxononanoate transaminase [Nitrospirota bacterium]